MFLTVPGPVAGAFLAEYEGWRWVFRLIAILVHLTRLQRYMRD